MPLALPVARSRVATRALVGIIAFTLLGSAVAIEPGSTSASGLGNQISANRSGQIYAERAMLAQDAVLAQVSRDLKSAKRDLKQARRSLAHGKRARTQVSALVRDRKNHLAQVEQEHAEALEESPPPEGEAPSQSGYEQRVKKLRQDVRSAERRQRSVSAHVRALARVKWSRQARLRSLKSAKRAAIYRREAAEGALASRIVQMTSLAAERADNQSAVSLTGQASFSWPTTGRIVQSYGCTGFYLNPRRGSCRHFHDGVDIVDGYGTPVRAVAVGVVAYVGWNPWDEGGRAWIVVVVHPDGYVSRYGHLIATEQVRAGELVHTGQTVGKMGSTGNSTGTHLHFELLRGSQDVNPLGYLPTGVIKIDKTSTKQGQRALQSKQKKHARAKQQAKARKAANAKADAEGAAAETVAPRVCEPVDPTVTTVTTASGDADGSGAVDGTTSVIDCVTEAQPSDALETASTPPHERLSAQAEPTATELPGVRLPPRGTSPAPA